jgi:hypothetical protein
MRYEAKYMHQMRLVRKASCVGNVDGGGGGRPAGRKERLLECGKSGWGGGGNAGPAVHFHPPQYGRCYLSKSSLSIFLSAAIRPMFSFYEMVVLLSY